MKRKVTIGPYHRNQNLAKITEKGKNHYIFIHADEIANFFDFGFIAIPAKREINNFLRNKKIEWEFAADVRGLI